MGDGVGQFDAAARDPGVIAAPRFQRGIGGKGLPRFGDLGFARKHQPGQHQRLCPCAAFGKAAVYQHLIDALFGRGARFWCGAHRRGRRGGHGRGLADGMEGLVRTRPPFHRWAMKANRATTGKVLWQAAAGGAVMLLLASCAPPPGALPPPPPRPVVQAPSVAGPGAGPVRGWREAAITPGRWRWQAEGGDSVARFVGAGGDSLLALRCDRATRRVMVERHGQGSDGGAGPATLSLATSTMTRPLTAQPFGTSPQAGVVVALDARDGLLDALAFSRGRFAVEVPGMAALYIPAAAELSRVIEDCR